MHLITRFFNNGFILKYSLWIRQKAPSVWVLVSACSVELLFPFELQQFPCAPYMPRPKDGTTFGDQIRSLSSQTCWTSGNKFPKNHPKNAIYNPNTSISTISGLSFNSKYLRYVKRVGLVKMYLHLRCLGATCPSLTHPSYRSTFWISCQ